eukprot:538881-Amphidinium_carterae.1
MSCCKCGSDSNITGCMFEGCDHYWCRFHCLKIDAEGVTEGVQAFWCACHKTTTPQDCRYPLRCGEPGEGECIQCADPRAIACECDGLVAGHRRCRNLVCLKHCKVFRDPDDNVAKIWCNDHGGERPGKYAPPTRRCSACYTKKTVFKCQWPGCRSYGCHDCHARRPGPLERQYLPPGVEPPEEYVTNMDFPITPEGEVITGPLMIQCVKHFAPIDTEYGRMRRTNVSEIAMVSNGTSAFTHVDVGEFNAESRRGRAYPPPVDTINPVTQFEDISTMRTIEPPMEALQNPLLTWERRDGESTTSEEVDSDNTLRRLGSSEAETRVPAPGDTLETSAGESVVEPPASKRVRRIELVHVPKQPASRVPERGYGPPTPPSENSDGEVPAHLRTKDDYICLMEERLLSNAIEISRRDEIIAKNQAVERNLEERRRNGRTDDRAAAAPAVSETLPKPSPPQPPPPKQPPNTLVRNMEQAMACAKAKNANTGWASNLVEAVVRAKDAMGSVLSTEGPVPVMKPAPTCPPK